MDVTLGARFLDGGSSGGNPLLQKLLHVTPDPFRGVHASLQPAGSCLFCCPNSLSLFSSCFSLHNARSSLRPKSSALREVPIFDPLPFGPLLCVWHISSDTWAVILSLSFGWGTVRQFGCPRQPDNSMEIKDQPGPQTLSESLIVLHC